MFDSHYGRLEQVVSREFCKIIALTDTILFVVLNNYDVRYIPESEAEQQDPGEIMCYTSCGPFEEPIDVIAALYE